MAKKTYWEMFEDVVDQLWLTNTFNDDTTETRRIKRDINWIQKRVLSMSKSYLKKDWVSISWGTVADQKAYDIPETVDKISLVKITVDDREYFPKELWIQDFNKFSNTEITSDIPVFYTIDKAQLVLYPTPETDSLPIELNANAYATDLDTDPWETTDKTTDLEIKEWYEDTIYYYALTEWFYRLEDFTSWDRYNKRFEEMFQSYKTEVKNPTNSVVVKGSTGYVENPNYYNTLTN